MQDLTPNLARPWESEYTIERTTVIAEAAELRVLEIALAPGDVIPWHLHSAIIDTFFCMQGVIEIDTRAPRRTSRVASGESLALPPKTPHRVRNGAEGRCRFVLVQGVGAYDFVPLG